MRITCRRKKYRRDLMKKDMNRLVELTERMARELHITNKIAISVSIVNVITLVVIAWGMLR